jgi:prolyl 4-hydroxylase
VPWPKGAGSQVWLDGGDRRVQALAVMREPNVIVLGQLLDEQECQALIEQARPRLARSLTVSVKTGGQEENADRTSQGMFFQRGETELIERIEQRLAHLLDWPVENGEGLQILRYGQAALRLLRPQRARHALDFAPRRPARGHCRDLPQRADRRRCHRFS